MTLRKLNPELQTHGARPFAAAVNVAVDEWSIAQAIVKARALDILGELSRRKGQSAEIMYTCDKKALEGDEIFVNFITGSHDAFVVEDADHMLTPRANGNHDEQAALQAALPAGTKNCAVANVYRACAVKVC